MERNIVRDSYALVGASIQARAEKSRAISTIVDNKNLHKYFPSDAINAMSDRSRVVDNPEDDDEISEIVIVYPPRKKEWNPEDMADMLAWAEEIWKRPLPSPPPQPVPSPNLPPPPVKNPDPCVQLDLALSSTQAALEADRLSLSILEDLLEQASTPGERKSIRAQIGQVKRSIKESEKMIKDINAAKDKAGC